MPRRLLASVMILVGLPLVALPLLSIVVFPSPRQITLDIPMHDTYYVVGHFHVGGFLVLGLILLAGGIALLMDHASRSAK